MADLVRVRIDNRELNLGRSFAEKHNLTVLDEPVEEVHGRPKSPTRTGGRRVKPKTSAAKKAATKRTAAKRTAAKKAVTEPARNEGVSK